MKRKFILFLLSVALLVQPAAMVPAYTANAATTGSSGKKLNLLSTTQCIVFEPNYKAENSMNLIPGASFTKDPYVKSESRYDAYCFARVEIPTTTFTTTDGTDVVGDAVKMLYGGKEGINAAEWKVIKEIPSATPGINSVYVVQYVGNSGILKKQVSTGRIFDSMTMPSTVSVAGVSKQVASVDDVTGSVSVQGFLVSSADAKDASDAYNSIRDELEETGNNTSNSNKYDDKLQGTVDVLQDEKRDLENQVKALEERLSTKLSTGDAKANEVISGKIFSNADAVDLTGTMPNYDKGYYGAENTSETYRWTDLSGKINTENKEGYQSKIENGTGLTRNSDGTITISAGYHAQQVVQGASGDATPDQVLSGVTFSNSSGPQTGTMPNNSTTTSNGNVPGINGSYTSIPTRDGSCLQYGVDTRGTARINICPPAGYYQGNGGSYVSAPASSFGNATSAHVLSGETFTSSAGLAVTGTMVNHGGYTAAVMPTPWVRDNGTTYIRFPMGAYLTSANNGLNLPEIIIADNLYSSSEYSSYGESQYNAGYQAGYAAGQSKSYRGSTSGTVTYSIGHHHTGSSSSGGGCFGTAVWKSKKVQQSFSGTYGGDRRLYDDHGTIWDKVYDYSWTCPYCHQTYGDNEVHDWGAYTASSWSRGVTHVHEVDTPYIDHYDMNCGKSEGQYLRSVTNNISNTAGPALSANEKIISISTSISVN